MRVAEFTGDAATWDAFVEATPGATFCHLSGWRDVMAEGLRRDLTLLAAREDGLLRGAMPLGLVRGPLGSFMVSVPFLNYGGPIGTPRAVHALVDHAVDAGGAEGVDLVELRCRARTWREGAGVEEGGDAEGADGAGDAEGADDTEGAGDVRRLGAARVGVPAGVRLSHRRVAVVLPLPDDPDELWRALRSKVRSQVRRPMKEDMIARFGAGQLDAFYDVFARNMRDLGTPVLPLRFFRSIVERLPGLVRVGVVYHGDTPAAAGFGFLWRGELEMTWASSLRPLSRLAPNMLLYWAFMRRAVEEGAGTFNFGRCPPGGGTHRFKLQWGGADEELPWLQWSAGNATGTPSPSSGRLALARRLWRRLPVSVATLLGPPIARTIP